MMKCNQVVIENSEGRILKSFTYRRWLEPNKNIAKSLVFFKMNEQARSVTIDDEFYNVFYVITTSGSKYKVCFYQV